MAKRGCYNRKNKLLQIIRVQEEFLKHANSGRSVKYIYDAFIYPRFLISKSTFYNYLATPAKRDLKRLENDDDKQVKLF